MLQPGRNMLVSGRGRFMSPRSASECSVTAREVAEFLVDLVLLGAFEGVLADGGGDAVDVAVVEVFEAGG
jgi:hypothetical protein